MSSLVGSDRTRPDDPVDSVERAESLARRLDRPMGALGLVFLLLVLAQSLATDPAVAGVLSWAGWGLWLVFVGEFVLRAYVAQDPRRFWRRSWWQVLFLAVPFLRFARALTLLRAARVGGVSPRRCAGRAQLVGCSPAGSPGWQS